MSDVDDNLKILAEFDINLQVSPDGKHIKIEMSHNDNMISPEDFSLILTTIANQFNELSSSLEGPQQGDITH